MNKWKLLVALVVTVFMQVATPAFGESSQVAPAAGDDYVVQEGDTLWDLSEALLRDPFLWPKVLEANPFLQEPGRVFVKDGKTIVLLRLGDRLKGLRELGIVPVMVPFSALKLEPAPAASAAVAEEGESVPAWLSPFLMVAFMLAYLAFVWAMDKRKNKKREEELQKDPVTSLPPQRGPLQDEIQLRRFYQSEGHLFQILELVKGRIWGVMNVTYRNGQVHERRMTGQEAFRAVVRHPNGLAESLYTLQACGNDLRFGNRGEPGKDFRFEPDPVAEPAPPVPAEEATATEEEAVAAATPVVEPAVQADATSAPVTVPVATWFDLDAVSPVASAGKPEEQTGQRLLLEFRRADGAQPNMLRIKGAEVAEFTFTVDEDGTTFRYKEK